MKNFEDFLKDKHAENYHGTDDDMPDAFDSWLTDDLQVDDLIQYANEYTAKKMIETKEKMLEAFGPMLGLIEEVKNLTK